MLDGDGYFWKFVETSSVTAASFPCKKNQEIRPQGVQENSCSRKCDSCNILLYQILTDENHFDSIQAAFFQNTDKISS